MSEIYISALPEKNTVCIAAAPNYRLDDSRILEIYENIGIKYPQSSFIMSMTVSKNISHKQYEDISFSLEILNLYGLSIPNLKKNWINSEADMFQYNEVLNKNRYTECFIAYYDFIVENIYKYFGNNQFDSLHDFNEQILNILRNIKLNDKFSVAKAGADISSLLKMIEWKYDIKTFLIIFASIYIFFLEIYISRRNIKNIQYHSMDEKSVNIFLHMLNDADTIINEIYFRGKQEYNVFISSVPIYEKRMVYDILQALVTRKTLIPRVLYENSMISPEYINEIDFENKDKILDFARYLLIKPIIDYNYGVRLEVRLFD